MVHLVKAGQKLEDLTDAFPGDKVYLQDGRTGEVTYIADVGPEGQYVPVLSGPSIGQ